MRLAVGKLVVLKQKKAIDCDGQPLVTVLITYE